MHIAYKLADVQFLITALCAIVVVEDDVTRLEKFRICHHSLDQRVAAVSMRNHMHLVATLNAGPSQTVRNM